MCFLGVIFLSKKGDQLILAPKVTGVGLLDITSVTMQNP